MKNLRLSLCLIFLCMLSASSQRDSCSSILAIDQFVSFNTTSLNCESVWVSENFILRYKATAPSLWSFVLSAPDSNSWIAIGFSKMAGRMQGSSAVVGWPTTNGDGAIKQYYLNGYSRSSVLPDQGDLAIVNSALVQQFSMLYLAFQLKTTTPLSSLLFAVGPMDVIPDAGNFLDRHRSYTSVTLDFSAGNNTTSPAANGGSGESDDGNNSDGTSPGSESGSGSLQPGNSFREPAGGSRRSSVPSEGSSSLTTRRTHGIINIMTWILILPLGITAARHYKHHEPSWFYHHIALQMVGFGLVIGGIVTGMNLEDQSAGVDRHKALGFVALSLACCQVTALLVRPDKNSKFRRYWNWYHHWVGRSALLIGVINTFYGIKLARESRSWYEYVGIVLGIWGLSSIVLEVKKIYGARNDEHEFLQPASNDA